MRRTDHIHGPISISSARDGPEDQLFRQGHVRRPGDLTGALPGLGIQAGYEFGRIPIFPVSRERHRVPDVSDRPITWNGKQSKWHALFYSSRRIVPAAEGKASGHRDDVRRAFGRHQWTAAGPGYADVFETRFGVDLGRVRIFQTPVRCVRPNPSTRRPSPPGADCVWIRSLRPETASGRGSWPMVGACGSAGHPGAFKPTLSQPAGPSQRTQAEVQRLAEEMNQLAVKNAWARVDRTYRQIETLGRRCICLAQDPATLHFLGAQAAGTSTSGAGGVSDPTGDNGAAGWGVPLMISS